MVGLSTTMLIIVFLALQALGESAPSGIRGDIGQIGSEDVRRTPGVRAARSASMARGAVLEAAGTSPGELWDRSSTPAGAADPDADLEILTTTVTEAVRPRAGGAPVKPVTTSVKAPTRPTTSVGAKASSPTTAKPKPTTTTTTTTSTTAPPPPPANVQEGLASWYNAAAPGTCAHRLSPMGTVLTVTNLATGERVSCRVSDRGPYVDGRVVDLSREDFSRLAHTDSGVIRVRVEW